VNGIIFCGNSAYSTHIFKIQKRLIRIIMNANRRESCRQLFKNQIHNINARFSSDLHTTPAKLTYFKNAFERGGVPMERRYARH
jgi:hypothetical protein